MSSHVFCTLSPETLPSTRQRLAITLRTLLVTSCLLAGVFKAAPAQVVYTDRNAFNAAVASANLPIATEGYESYPNDLQAGARTITLSHFNVSYDVNDSDSGFGVTDVINPLGGSGIGPTAGVKFLYAAYPTAAVPNGTVSFLFGTPINVFGTDIKDLELTNLTYSTSSGANGIAASPGADGNVQFFGIISNTAFTSIGLTEAGVTTGDGVTFDQTVFSSVPEPSSVLFGLVGVLGITSVVIRRGTRRLPKEQRVAVSPGP
jgi:hypothetical protein